ncbi:MAG: glycosyltransferase family 2 protein [Oscillospiraceae bacterium]|nr:glycosyltransferase family 2 protein [Oscillospiraceae bacterium]
MKTVTMIVPCFNEAEVIPLFYQEVSKVLGRCKNYSFKLLFVDDGSSDATLEILRAMAERTSSVKYISFSRNFGKEAAMLAGMRYADTEYVGIIDADLQHSPELIPHMLNALDIEGYDVAAARRTDRAGESKLRSFLSSRFYSVVNKTSDININDNSFDYRIMKRKVVDAILSLPEHVRFSKGIFSWVGFNIKWFEHGNIERAAGETKWSLKALLKYAFDGILGFTTAPLRLPFWAGLFTLIVSVMLFVYGIVRLVVENAFDPTYSMLLSAILFVGGLTFVFIGILGEYIARSYVEIKARPVFIVSETNMDKDAQDAPGFDEAQQEQE